MKKKFGSLIFGLIFLSSVLLPSLGEGVEILASAKSATMKLPPVAIAADGGMLVAENAKKLPKTALFTLDDEGNVASSGETSVSLEAAVTKVSSKVVPVVQIETQAAAEVYTAAAKANSALADLLLCSSDAQLLKELRTTFSAAGGVLDLSQSELPESNFELVKLVNSSYARTVIVSAAACTRDLTDYLQNRFLTVWAKAETEEEEVVALYSGVYGIVTNDFARVNTLCSSVDGAAFTRTLPIIGHRGINDTDNNVLTENSLATFNAAYDAGATHIETDVQLSTDGQLVIMHDDTLNRTTTCTKTSFNRVEDLTLSQIRSYTLLDGQEIPTLEDMFKQFKGKDVILVIELKTNTAGLVPALKELTEKYDMWEQIVCISFYGIQLKYMMTQMPEIPTAFLDSVSSSNFAAMRSAILNRFNSNIDTSKDLLTVDYVTNTLVPWGYNPVGWTYSDNDSYINGFHNGVCGMTVNSVSPFSDGIASIVPEESYQFALDELPEKLTGTRTLYSRDAETTSFSYNVVYGELEKVGDKALVVLYEDSTLGGVAYRVYSETVTIEIVEKTVVSPPETSDTTSDTTSDITSESDITSDVTSDIEKGSSSVTETSEDLEKTSVSADTLPAQSVQSEENAVQSEEKSGGCSSAGAYSYISMGICGLLGGALLATKRRRQNGQNRLN